jgi:hypothetical protein
MCAYLTPLFLSVYEPTPPRPGSATILYYNMVLDLSLDQMSRNPSFLFVSNNCVIVGASVPHLEKQMLAKKIQSKINKKFNSNNIRFAYIQ